MKVSKLVRKTILGVLVLFGAVVLATSVISGWNLNNLLSEQYESKGAAIASSIASSSVEILLNRDASTLQSIIDQYTEIQGVSYVFIVDEQGEIVAHTFVPTIPKEAFALSGRKTGLVTRSITIEGVGDFSDVSSPILAGVAGYVHVGMNKGIIAAQIRSAILATVIGVALVMVILVSGMALWLRRRITSPILALTDSAHKIEKGEPFDSERLVSLTRTGDEIADLTRVFMQMATALERRAEDERVAAEARYRSLFDGVPVGLYRTSPDGQFLDANPALVDIMGYPDRASLMGVTVSSTYVNQDDRMRWCEEAERSNTMRGFEFQLQRPDGTVIWVRNSAQVVRAGDGQVQYYDGAIEDITQRKMAEEQVREARDAANAARIELQRSLSLLQRHYDNQSALNSLLRLSLEDVPLESLLSGFLAGLVSVPWISVQPKGGVFLVDSDSESLVMTAQRNLDGLASEACARVPFGTCLCGRAAVTREIVFAGSIDERHEIIYDAMAPHGHYCVPLLSGGELLGVMTIQVKAGHTRDKEEEDFLRAVSDVMAGIIQRKRAQEKLRNAMSELEIQYHASSRARSEARAILDSASDTMVLVSPDGRIVSVNSRFDGLFSGGSPLAVIGRNIDDFSTAFDRIFADAEGFRALMSESLADREKQFAQVVSQRWPVARELHLYSTPVVSLDSEFLGRLYVFRDVTRELEVDRMKSEFISLVSHELRTPLTSIKGYVDLLMDGEVGEVPEEQLEFLGIVKSNADRLVTLINDLLDISRIESGRVELKLASVDVVRIIRGVVTLLKPQIESKGQELSLDLPAIPVVASGDSDRVTQIVTNLLSNAYKYTPAGGTIGISVRTEGEWVRVEVQDSGIGLSEEEQAQLFTKFFRAKNRTTQEVGGTGLGLPIVKSLVEMHGGKITVFSAPGQGSTFAFTLPAVQDVQEVHDSPRIEGLATTVGTGGLVLVVDDEPDIANLLRRYLAHGGYDVLIAGNGADALQLAKSELPDLITLDVKLPDVDGFTVLEWLKSDSTTSSIPVVMISMIAEEAQGKLLGAVDFITKPAEEHQLLKRVARVLTKNQAPVVLVADDDTDVRRLLVGFLQRAGYQVLEARDGVEALDMARRNKPGLVLLDLRMPGMDGVATLRELRADESIRDIPVLIMTASPGALEENGPQMEMLGISGLLNKPFSAEELATAITEGLNCRGELSAP